MVISEVNKSVAHPHIHDVNRVYLYNLLFPQCDDYHPDHDVKRN